MKTDVTLTHAAEKLVGKIIVKAVVGEPLDDFDLRLMLEGGLVIDLLATGYDSEGISVRTWIG